MKLPQPRDIPDAAPTGGPQSADISPEWVRWRSHPGFALTPRTVVGILRTAEDGFPAEQCDLFEDMKETDGHLRSQLENRSGEVAGKEWIIQAGGDKPRDIQAAEALSEDMRAIGNLHDTIEHQLTVVPDGYAPTEMIWGPSKHGTIAPLRFINVPHRRILFDKAGTQRLVTNGHLWDGEELRAGGWWFATRRHRLIQCAGLMRTAVWWSLFKRMAVRDWVAFCERFGLPLPIGKYPDNMVEKEKEALRRAVRLIGRDGYATFSELGNIEFAKVEVGGAQEVHPALADFCNAEISKLISGATLTSGEGSSAGSYALGKVHQNVAFSLVVSDAMRIANGFAEEIGKPYVKWNFPDAQPPRLRVNVVQEMDPQLRLNVYDFALNKLGLSASKDQARQEFQIKPPRDPADELGGARASGGGAPGAPGPGGTPGGGAKRSAKSIVDEVLK